ncbi:MAG: aromatic hydrocarbon degradation protein [Bacteroidales bacterium]|nr:aromatic hydrocarbon degradation protein [Bacteroidales bacterium]
MRKLLTFFAAMLITGSLLAGGLVTNTNQSAMFTRLQNRNASTGIDAVYFNPAGLTKLGDGFYLSLSNQTIGQTKTIGNNYNYLAGTSGGTTSREFIGDVSAPLFPSVYVAYNTGKLSFSAGFNPIGGGGGAKYDKGLPSFEMGIASIVPMLDNPPNNIETSLYSADIFFEGSSVYFGYQANVGYKINDMLSIAAGVRLVSAANTYNGYLRNISVNPNYPNFGAAYTGGMVLANDFFTSGAATLNGLAAGATSYVAGLQPLIDGGAGTVLLSNGTAVGLTAVQVGQIQQIIGAAGQDPTSMDIATAQIVLGASAPVFTAKAGSMSAYAGATQDIEVDAEESGMGYTPILSVNFSPSDKLNIAVKYEFQTKLELTTKVIDNKGGGIFTEGKKVVADMPAMLAIGVNYKPMDKLSLAASFNTYFDKNVDYDGSESINTPMIDNNFLEYGLGAEYSITEKLRASAGWVATATGVNQAYQNDQRYSTNTNSFGAGFGYRISSMIDLNIGGQYTFYQEDKKDYPIVAGTYLVPFTETYNKKVDMGCCRRS